MFDTGYTKTKFGYRKNPDPPADLFPEALKQYLESVDNEKVVYKFPFYIQYRQPDQSVLDALRLRVEAELWADPERDYRVTFYYY